MQPEPVKTEKVDINNMLYILPTLENALPEFENKVDTNNLYFHEDDWRQVEFLPKDQKNMIEAEFEKIKDIYENHTEKRDSAFLGFKKLSVRELITSPVLIDKTALKILSGNNRFNGVALSNNQGQVKNGFSFASEGIDYYGQFDGNDKVKWFCIYNVDEDIKRTTTKKLAAFLKKEKLYLIDWVQMRVFDETNVEKAFQGEE
jgi:hypothetical protein